MRIIQAALRLQDQPDRRVRILVQVPIVSSSELLERIEDPPEVHRFPEVHHARYIPGRGREALPVRLDLGQSVELGHQAEVQPDEADRLRRKGDLHNTPGVDKRALQHVVERVPGTDLAPIDQELPGVKRDGHLVSLGRVVLVRDPPPVDPLLGREEHDTIHRSHNSEIYGIEFVLEYPHTHLPSTIDLRREPGVFLRGHELGEDDRSGLVAVDDLR